jgi:hypothetical protein
MLKHTTDTVVDRVEVWIAEHGRKNDPDMPWVWENDLFLHSVAGVRTRADWKPTLERYAQRNPGHVKPLVTPGKPGPKPRQVFAPMRVQLPNPDPAVHHHPTPESDDGNFVAFFKVTIRELRVCRTCGRTLTVGGYRAHLPCREETR